MNSAEGLETAARALSASMEGAGWQGQHVGEESDIATNERLQLGEHSLGSIPRHTGEGENDTVTLFKY